MTPGWSSPNRIRGHSHFPNASVWASSVSSGRLSCRSCSIPWLRVCLGIRYSVFFFLFLVFFYVFFLCSCFRAVCFFVCFWFHFFSFFTSLLSLVPYLHVYLSLSPLDFLILLSLHPYLCQPISFLSHFLFFDVSFIFCFPFKSIFTSQLQYFNVSISVYFFKCVYSLFILSILIFIFFWRFKKKYIASSSLF